MNDRIIPIGDSFWNLRGSFRIFGLMDIGTHVSLVRLRSGGFVFLDSYTLDDDTRRWVMELTGQGAKVEAIINLHPFHTVHCTRMHQDFPAAKLYGSRRHVARAPELPWQALHSDDSALHALFADDLQFSVPRGVDFISADEKVHFSSVLAYHPSSRSLHSDDTLMYLKIKGPLGWLVPARVGFHPTLTQALEKRPGAAADFRAWARDLANRWQDAENLCAAHNQALTRQRSGAASLPQQIIAALARVEPKLAAHEKKYR